MIQNFLKSSLLLFFSSLSFAAPGDLVAFTPLGRVESTEASIGRKSYCPESVNFGQTLGYQMIRIEYRTNNLKGSEINAFGLLLLPDGEQAYPLYVYQHGTLVGRSELPSQNLQSHEGRAAGYCFASRGYVSILADYIGYNDGNGTHPYLHADSEAWVVRDLMRALRVAALQMKYQMNSQIFMAGYSQGGHATMALLRLLEQDPQREFIVTAAAPMAGPYNLSKTFAEVPKNPSRNSAIEGAFVVAGLNPIYGFAESLDEIVQPPYSQLVSTFFDGTHTFKEALAQFSMKIDQLFQPSFLKGDLLDPESRFRRALEANNVDRWTPKTPVRFYHGQADLEVPFFNSQETFEYMKSKGANVELVNLGANIDHQSGFVPSMAKSAIWFESLRK